jgi:hypothetical protein
LLSLQTFIVFMLVSASDYPSLFDRRSHIANNSRTDRSMEAGATARAAGEDHGRNCNGNDAGASFFPFWPESQRHELPLLPAQKVMAGAIALRAP